MKLVDMVSIVQGEWLQKIEDVEITSFESDTRKDLVGAAFFAFCGDNFDGHDYLDLAIEKGAKLLIVSRDLTTSPENVAVLKVADTIKAWQDVAQYKVGQSRAFKIGVTGSSGKTSTNAILTSLLEWFYPKQVLSTLGNTNNHIGVAQNIMRLKGDEKVISLEMGTNHPGEIAVLSKIVKPEIAILTTVGASHIGNFEEVSDILNEKVDLFRYMKEGGTAILPIHLLEQALAVGGFESSKLLTFGESAKADFILSDVEVSGEGSRFTLELPDNKIYNLKTNLSGVHQVHNIAAAIAVLYTLELDLDECLQIVLPNLNLPGMRMRKEQCAGVNYVLDCYNANPQSTAAFLEWLMEVYKPQETTHYVVLGDMLELGHMSEKYHREIIELFSSLKADRNDLELICVGDEYNAIPSAHKNFLSSKAAAQYLGAKIRSGDTVLLKGSRGIRLETIYTTLIGEE